MSLSEQERKNIFDVLNKTSMHRGAPKYPSECYEFPKLCEQETISRTVDNYEYTIHIMTAENRVKNCPVHINIHGGGFIAPHMENDTMFSAYVANGIKGIVVDIDYTTSDKAPWPVAFDQCYDAAQYVFAHCSEWNCDPKRVSMGGYSAGGALTAGIALKSGSTGDFQLCLQILGYPPLDNLTHPLYKKEGYIRAVSAERELAFTKLYLDGNISFCENPYASPVYASDEALSHLPRTLVCTAEGCNFRYEDEEYAERIASVGVEVTVKRFLNTIHGFIPHFNNGWEEATDLIIRTINSATL